MHYIPTNWKRLKGLGVIYSYYVIIGVQYSDLLDRTQLMTQQLLKTMLQSS
jgi:hypothetical protein